MNGGEKEGGGGEPPLDERYRAIERIGSGGAAMVYRAEDERLGREVAIKRLHSDGPEDAARRFLREAQIGAGLSHPNLVTVYDAFADGDSLVVVMELIDGPDLGEAVKEGPLERERAIGILGDVGSALDHIHAAGIVHRDVKPSNVLLDPDGSARLTDLGIARVLEDSTGTQPGSVMGSAPYMSPEQLLGERVSAAADVYALAVTAYEMLSGEPARSGMPVQIAYQVTENPPPDIRTVRPEVPDSVAETLKRGMAREPGDRPASPGALVAELRTALEGEPESEPTPVVAPEPTAVRPVEPPLPPFTANRVPQRDAERSEAPAPASPPRATPSPPSRERTSAGRRLVPALLLLALGAVALVVILSSGGGEEDATPTVAEDTTTTTEQEQGNGNGEGGSGNGGSAASAGSPERAVQDFYELAAADNFEGVVAVASPNLEATFGGAAGFQGTFTTLESIEFTTLEAVSQSGGTAEVELGTVATHDTFIDTCTGTASLVAEGDEWLLDSLSAIECDREELS